MEGMNEKAYWIAIAHLPKWTTENINRLIVQVLHEKQMEWPRFFEMEKEDWRRIFQFNDKELFDLVTLKNDLPRLAFIAEQLQNEGFHIIPINSPDYPPVLKENLKMKSAPPVIYLKGRKSLLQEDAVAIVGSRNAGKAALDFTDLVAKKCVKEGKVVVSGFAKGVDKQALDSTLEGKGKSIIVLPQGILTFQTGFKKYYAHIVGGDVAVLSTFFPHAGWDVGFAMARNAYIYGLAKEIYVAESDSSGGTWEGALLGLKRKRTIYVRFPEAGENNANSRLLDLGALAMDHKGEIMSIPRLNTPDMFENVPGQMINDSQLTYLKVSGDIEKEILDLLKKGAFTVEEIKLSLKLDWDGRKLTAFLKKQSGIKAIPGKPVRYTLNKLTSPTLFG
jgi:predicted Rossmann fold nucleotide-binding protein DprA/Smf involved in DNA uptake